MAQVTHGLRSLLGRASNYDLLQTLIGAPRGRRTLAQEYIQAESEMRVLDIGCGTGSILTYLPPVDYLGFDLNPGYVAAARERFGERGRFRCADVNAAPPEAVGHFDRILAISLLHHLDDSEVAALMEWAHRLLSPRGRFITVDPCHLPGQSAVARFLIQRDRGRNIRTAGGYSDLARTVFSAVEVTVREDLLRVPYTHAILQCELAPGLSTSGIPCTS